MTGAVRGRVMLPLLLFLLLLLLVSVSLFLDREKWHVISRVGESVECGVIIRTTVEPLNNGHIGSRNFVLYREVVLSSEVKMYYNSIIEKGPQSVSFIER